VKEKSSKRVLGIRDLMTTTKRGRKGGKVYEPYLPIFLLVSSTPILQYRDDQIEKNKKRIVEVHLSNAHSAPPDGE
jgi:hypothetical protein